MRKVQNATCAANIRSHLARRSHIVPVAMATRQTETAGNAATALRSAAQTGCALPRRVAARRAASITSERLIAALTIALEADVIDGLMVQTIAVNDELQALSELPATATVLALRAEKSAEYRRLAAATHSVLTSKAECYALLRSGR